MQRKPCKHNVSNLLLLPRVEQDKLGGGFLLCVWGLGSWLFLFEGLLSSWVAGYALISVGGCFSDRA